MTIKRLGGWHSTSKAMLPMGAVALSLVCLSARPQMAEGLNPPHAQRKQDVAKASEPDDGAEDRIVAAKRIGKISIGMSATDLFQAMGDATVSGEFANGRWYRFGGNMNDPQHPNAGTTIAVIFNKTSRVTTVETFSSRFATAEGIRVGDSELALEAKQGSPQRREYVEGNEVEPQGYNIWWYKQRSLEFSIQSGKITSIKIWARD